MSGKRHVHNPQSGFTAVEMLVAMIILGVVTAGIFAQIDLAQQRSFSEQVKLDNFQEARDFVDQFFRDVNQIGYPNSRMVDTNPLTTSWVPLLTSPLINDYRMAIGLVKVDANEIRFEGDMNGDGVVQSIIYVINGSTSCPLCLQRSQVDKAIADPLTGQATNWGTEVNDVISNPIFSYFKADGTPVTGLPVDISTPSGAQTIASIKTIKVSLTIRNNKVVDPKTQLPLETDFEGEVSLNNCSMAASGAPMSCN